MLEVVAALIENSSGQFLICQRPAHKARGLQWEFPGGKIEKGESADQALVRECREEMDISVRCEGEYMDLIHEYPDLTVHLHLIRCRIEEGEPKKIEHGDIRWIDIAQADAFDFCPADRIFIERMKKEISIQAGRFFPPGSLHLSGDYAIMEADNMCGGKP